MGKNIHVVKRGDHWSAVQEKAKRSSGNFRTQAEAVERAKEITCDILAKCLRNACEILAISDAMAFQKWGQGD